MRKGFSILFILLLVLTGARVTIATHYCGGEIAAKKISLSGKLASCGMEVKTDKNSLPGEFLKTHCCDNEVATIGVINNYFPPVLCTDVDITSQKIINYLPLNQLLQLSYINIDIYTSISPPGKLLPIGPNLSDICVFRI